MSCRVHDERRQVKETHAISSDDQFCHLCFRYVPSRNGYWCVLLISVLFFCFNITRSWLVRHRIATPVVELDAITESADACISTAVILRWVYDDIPVQVMWSVLKRHSWDSFGSMSERALPFSLSSFFLPLASRSLSFGSTGLMSVFFFSQTVWLFLCFELGSSTC